LLIEESEVAVPSETLKFLQMSLQITTDECIFWEHDSLRIGRPVICFKGKQKFVTRLICELVHGSPPSKDHEAAHSCGNGHLRCINWKHLSWKLPEDNKADKIRHGTWGRKLKPEDIIGIRRSAKSKW
jgi:hypothetical protein